MRFMYLAYNVEPYPANGSQVVSNYTGSRLVKINNGSPQQAPQPGDIMSFGATTTNGHTSVVVESQVDANGNGTIRTLNQNLGGSGTDILQGYLNLTLNNWYVLGDATGWLHDPSNNASPTTSVALISRQPGVAGWYGTDVQLSFSVTDGQPPVNIYAQLDGGSIITITSPINVTDEGWHTVVFHAEDSAGKREADQIVSFGIDRTPPVLTIQATGTPTMTWTLTASDTLSSVDPASLRYSADGVSFQPYTQPVQLAATPTFWAQATDRAGNMAIQSARSLDITSDDWVVSEVRARGPKPHIVGATHVSDAGITNRRQRIPVRGGAAYIVQAQVRSESVTGGIMMRISFRDMAGHGVGETDLPMPGGTYEWTTINGQVNAPSKAASAEIELRLAGWGRVWFDDVRFADVVQPDVNLATDPGFERPGSPPGRSADTRARAHSCSS
jgi:hypothetical protein